VRQGYVPRGFMDNKLDNWQKIRLYIENHPPYLLIPLAIIIWGLAILFVRTTNALFSVPLFFIIGGIMILFTTIIKKTDKWWYDRKDKKGGK
jgi:hypothetical protein